MIFCMRLFQTGIYLELSLVFNYATTTTTKSLRSCPTLCDPIDRQPTRLPHPWDSPGKNTEKAMTTHSSTCLENPKGGGAW